MMAPPCVVLYGDSMFLAGIRADLQCRTDLDLATIEPECPDAVDLIRGHCPVAVLFDVAAAQPGFAVALLRDQPGLLLIGVDASSDDLFVLSGRAEPGLSMADLVKVIASRVKRRKAACPPGKGIKEEGSHE